MTTGTPPEPDPLTAGLSEEPARHLLARAAALIDMRRAAEAIPLLQQAIAADPQHSRPRCLLSLALLRSGDASSAVEAAGQAIAIAPEEEWGYRLLSSALMAKGPAYRAVAPAQEALRLAPHQPETLLTLANAALASHLYELADATIPELLRVAPESAAAHYTAGRLALERRRNTTAAEHFREALRLDPLDCGSHNNLGVALLRLGDRKAALSAFSAAAKLDATDSTAADNIAQMAREDRLPLPGWARGPVILLGPAVLVAVARGLVRRRHYRSVPRNARQEVFRWTVREAFRVGALILGGIAALGLLALRFNSDVSPILIWLDLGLLGASLATIYVMRIRSR